jgi:hypothetical protein
MFGRLAQTSACQNREDGAAPETGWISLSDALRVRLATRCGRSTFYRIAGTSPTQATSVLLPGFAIDVSVAFAQAKPPAPRRTNGRRPQRKK